MANITVPAKHYIGMIKRNNDQLPLGFITPWGEDSSAKKRMATVDNWASYNSGSGQNTNNIKPIIFDNSPMFGFKLTSGIRTSGYGGETKWRIEDPRGFELEITSGNLGMLMSLGVFDKGEYTDQCVWGRCGANNILLSINSEEYIKATENTVVAKQSASWNDVKLGDTVVLQNNQRGVYLGRQFALLNNGLGYNTAAGSNIGNNELVSSSKSLYVIYKSSDDNASKKQELHLISSPKLSSIIKCDAELTKFEAEALANKLVHSKSADINIPGYRTIVALSFNKLKSTDDYNFTLVPENITSEQNVINRVKSRYNNTDHIFVNIDSNTVGLIYSTNSHYYNNNTNTFSIMLYSKSHLNQNELRGYFIRERINNYYGSTPVNYTNRSYKSDDTYFTLHVSIRTKLENVFSYII